MQLWPEKMTDCSYRRRRWFKSKSGYSKEKCQCHFCCILLHYSFLFYSICSELAVAVNMLAVKRQIMICKKSNSNVLKQ